MQQNCYFHKSEYIQHFCALSKIFTINKNNAHFHSVNNVFKSMKTSINKNPKSQKSSHIDKPTSKCSVVCLYSFKTINDRFRSWLIRSREIRKKRLR
jgi:hypothetical protein